MASLTWLGHSAFLLASDEGKRIYIDPFLNGNPSTPDDLKSPDTVDVIAITHGHGDHVGDTVALSQAFPDAHDRRAGRAQDAGSARRARTSATCPA